MEIVKNEYQICKRCVMDSSDREISFDARGFCNHCNGYFENESTVLVKGEKGKLLLENIIRSIKESQKNNPRTLKFKTKFII